MHRMTAIWCHRYLLAPVTWGYSIPFPVEMYLASIQELWKNPQQQS